MKIKVEQGGVMTIFTGTFIPYEFKTRYDCLSYIEERAMGIKKSLKFLELDTEHLVIKCPVSGETIEVVGDEFDLDWLHAELTKRKWYKL